MIRLKQLLTEGNGPLKNQWLDKGLNIAKQLISRGFTEEQSAAIVGNMWAESTFNPAAENGIGAIGLLQWLGNRRDSLKNYAKQRGKTWNNLNVQLDFIKYELLDAYDGDNSYERNMFKKAMQFGKNIQDKSEGFARLSERPGASELIDSLPTRRIAAENIFNALIKRKDIKSSLIGITVYPLKKNGFVNVREDAEVNAGFFDNLVTTIKYPNAVGSVTRTIKGADGKDWHEVILRNNEIGFVRADVVTNVNPNQYIVQSGDTLTKISTTTGVSVDKLKQLNKLTSDMIQPGQKLKLR
jgi:LysM repeat protein